MIVKVKYSASSNISYKGTWTFKVDDDDWAEMDDAARDDLIESMVSEQMHNDISWFVQE